MPSHATFVKDTEFWCDKCDSHKVHSDKLETGKFFCQFGHRWKPSADFNGTGIVSDEYVQVIFAVCATCLSK